MQTCKIMQDTNTNARTVNCWFHNAAPINLGWFVYFDNCSQTLFWQHTEMSDIKNVKIRFIYDIEPF